MGYELTRFIGDIDEEFVCSICRMVLENPSQSPCEHHFCNECIKMWLKTSANCPIDRSLMDIDDIKPAARYFRNLLHKLEIKCVFYPDGCESVVKLEYLQHHINSCAYNSDPESFDDNKKLSENDFESMYSCSSHLIHRMSETIHQPEHFRDTIYRQKQKLDTQDNQIAKLNDEVNRLRILVSGQQKNIAMTVPSMWTKQWQKICNMKISKDNPNIFESSTDDNGATAQLLNPLQPTNSSFKVEILKQGVISIGLTSTDHPIHNSMGTAMGYYEDSVGYCSRGSIMVDRKETTVSRNWQIGEIIECGIIFPYNFVNYGNQIVTVYFTKNNELVSKVMTKMPSENFFPTIMIDFGIGKVKYLN